MQFLRRHWYNVGAVVALATAVYLYLAWPSISVLQRLSALNFIALLVHQFEEYGWPGGEPAIMNVVLRKSAPPDRYPLNQNSAMITNLFCAYVVYLLPVVFPAQAWLAIPPVLFGFGQFVVHGIVTNRKMHSLYNPGLAAVVLLHYPVGIAYIWYGQAHGLIGLSDWVIGLAYLAVFLFLFVRFTYSWMPDRNSPHPFADVEMRRFGVIEKMAALSANDKSGR